MLTRSMSWSGLSKTISNEMGPIGVGNIKIYSVQEVLIMEIF